MLHAHTSAEARLFLQITPCPKCSRQDTVYPSGPARPGKATITELTAPCQKCGESQRVQFMIAGEIPTRNAEVPAINPTDDHSQIIDVGQWMTLARMFMEQAKAAECPSQARTLNLHAAECLEEALKFYEDLENDLPSGDAFFTEASRCRFRDFPQQFSHSRLVSLRRKLPNLTP